MSLKTFISWFRFNRLVNKCCRKVCASPHSFTHLFHSQRMKIPIELIQQNTEEILRENDTEKRAEAALFIQLLHFINSKNKHNAAKLDCLDYY